VQIATENILLKASLAIPESAHGAVLFAHGSGSSSRSRRNRYVAEVLQEAGFATLLLDLLSAQEEAIDSRTAALRFDIELLAKRLTAATWWLCEQHELSHLPIGYFGASTGAAAALMAAAGQADLVNAVVSRGGRPDLAGSALDRVLSPTLLIVGSRDDEVLELNRRALARLAGKKKKLEIIPGATHLFEEAGALETVGKLAREWFKTYLMKGRITQRAA
jgi:dienelactone hydrolase